MSAVATFADNVLTITAGTASASISVADISRNFDALTHFPDRRAALALGELGNALNMFAGHVDKIILDGGALDRADEVARFTARHVSLYRRAWGMDSRCMSAFIVGPAKFPVERNRKRQTAADRAYSMVSEHRAAAYRSIERTAWPHGAPGDAIRSNNPDAPSLIRAKIDSHRQTHGMMKAANAAIRAAKSSDPVVLAEAVRGATGLSEKTCAAVVKEPYQGAGIGFASYQLSGQLAEIKRLEGRLATLETNAKRGTVESLFETKAGTVRIVENPEAARVQLIFPGKPDDATRTVLKSHAFRWAPSEGAWQRHLNNAGRYAVKCVIQALEGKPVATV